MAIQNGDAAPDFELASQFGARVALSDFAGKRPVVLVFFPLAFSITCTGELSALRDNLTLFTEVGAELIGISVDSKASLRAFAEREGYDFTLLADFWPHGEVAQEYGVFLDDRGYANRATFIIDADGIVRASFMTAPGRPRSIDDYRRALGSILPSRV
jgi:mycoredoxin-dependent peroxiredoxin